MILTIDEAHDALRVDGSDNDAIITGLLEAIPDYLEACTGLTEAHALAGSAIVKTAAKFILQLWYNPDGSDADKLKRVIDNLLKTLSSMVATYNK